MDPNAPPPPPSGLVLVDKPARRAVSSMTVCRAVKRRLIAGGVGDPRRRRNIAVGHAGTLDPLASGLLIVLVGRSATRLCGELMNGAKEYEAEIDLLRSSASDDLETETTINDVKRKYGAEEVSAALATFRGEIMQRPPAFSAIWVDGVRSFNLARAAHRAHGARDEGIGSAERAGGEREDSASHLHQLAERRVTIHEIELVEYEWPIVRVRVKCSKGTYIRSLARDLGTAITGHPAVLTGLRRTAIGRFRVENAVELEKLPEKITQSDLIGVESGTGRS